MFYVHFLIRHVMNKYNTVFYAVFPFVLKTFIRYFLCVFSRCHYNDLTILQYGGLVLVFFIMELVCGILLIVWRNEAPEYLQDKMRKSFEHYNEDEALARSIDIAQNEVRKFLKIY